MLKQDKKLSNRTLQEIIAQISDTAYIQTFVKSGGMLKLVKTCADVVELTASNQEPQYMANGLGVTLKKSSRGLEAGADLFKNLEAVTRAAAAKKAIKKVLDSQHGMNALLQSEESFFKVGIERIYPTEP